MKLNLNPLLLIMKTANISLCQYTLFKFFILIVVHYCYFLLFYCYIFSLSMMFDCDASFCNGITDSSVFNQPNSKYCCSFFTTLDAFYIYRFKKSILCNNGHAYIIVVGLMQAEVTRVLYFRILENYEDGECIDLTGKETKIISNVMTELDSSACASSKVIVYSNCLCKYNWYILYKYEVIVYLAILLFYAVLHILIMISTQSTFF